MVCFTAAAGVAAQESEVLPRSETEVDLGPAVESARVQVRFAAEWLASGVDSWFGSKPFSEGGQVNDGQLSLNLYSRQGKTADTAVRFNARFRLPNVESHTYLFTGRDNTVRRITDKPASFDTKQQLLQPDTGADSAFFAGFGRMISESVDARIGFQGGLNLFAQGRFRSLWAVTPDDEFEFSQTVFATVKDRLGSSTTFSIQHRHSTDWVGRWLNAITATQADPDAEWNSSLGAYRSFGKQRQLSLEILASAKQNTGLPLTDYGVQVRWEQPVMQNRLIGEVVLGHFWPQSLLADQRSTAWAVGTGLKMRF
jgi:hypothetical protein